MKTSKKILSCLLAMVMLIGMLMLGGCQKEPLVIKDSDTYIVIKVTQEAMGDKSEMLLIEYMQMLKDQGQLEFTIADGMITSINGIENPADWSSCWMLFTSDETMSNTAWGSVEYEGKTYGSAVVGANDLKIQVGQLYIWVFQAMQG